MNAPRHILLGASHMAHLRDLPAIDAMPDTQLRALEKFMAFCAAHGLDAPTRGDFSAFAQLHELAPDTLDDLAAALAALGLGDLYCQSLHAVAQARHHRIAFNGICESPQRSYRRAVSLAPDALPQDWQATLCKLRATERFAASIVTRIENRLCMFAFSAQRHGHPVDLGNTAALKAFYADLRARSAHRNDGAPRWAYLRSAWEEFVRFARAHGLGAEVLQGLLTTYEELAQLERRQGPLKFAKLQRAGTASGLLGRAEAQLGHAQAVHLPHIRHARRNAAVAIALGIAVPSRPGDVQRNHVFGKGIFFEPERQAYRFHYIPEKTRGARADMLDIRLDPHWNRFIDALILQDEDPRYLAELRDRVFGENRPLYVNYDGSPCGYGWYSSAWHRAAQTGGHIARTLIYDELADLGEFGIQYARGVNHHISERIPKKYRSENAIRKSYELAQRGIAARSSSDDDISDLL